MYDESFLNKISSFGVLGYSIEKIIFLVDPDDPAQLERDIDTPGTDVYKAYWKGKTTGEYSMDKVLFDKSTKDRDTEANEKMKQRMHVDKINDKIKANFGL